MMLKTKNIGCGNSAECSLANVLKSIILKTSYDIEGEKKEQMYRELEKMREERHKENEAI